MRQRMRSFSERKPRGKKKKLQKKKFLAQVYALFIVPVNAEKKKKEREDRWDVIVQRTNERRENAVKGVISTLRSRPFIADMTRNQRFKERFRRVPRSAEAIHHRSTRSCTVDSVGRDDGTEASRAPIQKDETYARNWHQTDQSYND